MKVSSTHL